MGQASQLPQLNPHIQQGATDASYKVQGKSSWLQRDTEMAKAGPHEGLFQLTAATN